MSQSAGAFSVSPYPAPQQRVRKTNRVYAKRVPSSLTPDQQRNAVRMVRAGRSFHQVAYDLSVSESVIAELYVRDVERRVRELADQVSDMDADLRGKARRPAARGVAA